MNEIAIFFFLLDEVSSVNIYVFKISQMYNTKFH